MMKKKERIKNRKKRMKTTMRTTVALFAAAMLAFSCTDDATTGNEPLSPAGPVSFIVENDTRSAGELNTGNIASFSVYAHYTGTKAFATITGSDEGWTPNFMSGQAVTKTGGVWKYSPVKYWPAEPDEKVSFFALSPAPTGSNGVTAPAGDYTGGYPRIDFVPDVNPEKQLDFCVASSVDCTATQGAVPFAFRHTLTKITFSVKDISAKADLSLGIDRIILRNIGASGTLTFDATSAGFTWNITPGTVADYTLEQYSGHGSLPNLTMTNTMTNWSTPAGTLLLLPQTLGENATIETSLWVIYNGKRLETEIITSASIGGMTWPANKEVNYGLKYDIGSLTEMTIDPKITDWTNAKTNTGFTIY
ncbi:MAG: fimbrillin family protein [Mediterranea sp.]|nr:fimbrillin family protein [Mediterranea sp.]